MRVWFYAAIEPLAPARLTTRRSGDLLARIVADVETLEDFYVRVLVPPIVAVLVTAFGCVLLGFFDVIARARPPRVPRARRRRPAAAALGGCRARSRSGPSGRAASSAPRSSTRCTAWPTSSPSTGRTVTVPAVLALGANLDRTGERLALFRGLSVALAALLASLCAIAILGLSIPLVVGGTPRRRLPRAAAARRDRGVRGRPARCRSPSSCSARAGPRPAACYEVVDAPPSIEEPVEPLAPPTPGPLLPGLALDVRGVTFRYEPDGRAVLDDVELLGAGRRQPGRSSARAARASPRSSTCSSGSGTTRRARSSSAVATSAGCGRTTRGACSGSCPSGWTCSTRRSGTTSHWQTRT